MSLASQSRLQNSPTMILSSPGAMPRNELDAFDFDVSMMAMTNIIDDQGQLKNDSDSTSPIIPSSPFMLGDYYEKGHFLPSTSIIRNEVLEGVPLSIEALDTESQIIDGVAFRCIFCKYAKERAAMAVIRPQNLMEIHESVVQFEHKHVRQCQFIPSDIRKCYSDFKSRESTSSDMDSSMIADDQFLWVSSAIRRGLRNRPNGDGILYCPELSQKQEQESILQHGEHLEGTPQVNYVGCSFDEPHKNDVVFGRGKCNMRPGNKQWQRLMREVKSDQNCPLQEGEKARLIVDQIRKMSPPGRFLARDKNTKRWIDVGDDFAMKKTLVALSGVNKMSTSTSKAKTKGPKIMKKVKLERVTTPSSKIKIRDTRSLVGYYGVSKTKSRITRYEARFKGVRIGSYKLSADAALAHDGIVRTSGLITDPLRINFICEKEYKDARDKELDERSIDVDLTDTLKMIEHKVGEAMVKLGKKDVQKTPSAVLSY